MATVTDLKPQRGNKARVSLYLDDSFCCGLEAITALKYNVKIGSELDVERLKEIQAESEGATAFDKAVKKITGRLQTRRQIKKYLAEKGYFPEVIEGVVEKLERYRYIDDLAYARSYINSQKEKKGMCRLKAELLHAGVNGESAELALSQLEDQVDSAYNCAKKYLRTREYARPKVFGYLFNKGYKTDDITAALARIKRELDEGEDEFEEGENI